MATSTGKTVVNLTSSYVPMALSLRSTEAGDVCKGGNRGRGKGVGTALSQLCSPKDMRVASIEYLFALPEDRMAGKTHSKPGRGSVATHEHKERRRSNDCSGGLAAPTKIMKPAVANRNLADQFPEIAREWHPSKNEGITPEQVTPGSSMRAWWRCEKGHEWQTRISHRTSGRGCPECSKKRAKSDNNLAVINPALAEDWHPTRNGELTPYDVTPKSNKKVWWQCPSTHEWPAVIAARTKGSGCPFCSGRKATPENNLALKFPDVAREWHPSKNGELSPRDVAPMSDQKVWWQCQQGHEWPAQVKSRAKGNGCPYCAGKVASPEHCLAARFPEIAKEWHPLKNSGLTPSEVTPGSGSKVWWICEKSHEWVAAVCERTHRTRPTGCPMCSGNAPSDEDNLAVKFPDLAKEWHPTKNGSLTPYELRPKSNRKVWWKCKRGHEWKAAPNNRTKPAGCPRCTAKASRAEIRLFCEIKTMFPGAAWQKKIGGMECDVFVPEYYLAVEYDGEYPHRLRDQQDVRKNRRLSALGVMLFRVREAGLKALSERDVVLAKREKGISVVKKLLRSILDHAELPSEVVARIKLYMDKNKLADDHGYRRILSFLPGPEPKDSLLRLYPLLAAEWNYEKNHPLEPSMFTPGSGMKVWWKCREGHEWKASIDKRTKGRGCAACGKRRGGSGNNLSKKFPLIAREWHPVKNGFLEPSRMPPSSSRKVWWMCEKGHEWESSVRARVKGKGCSKCRSLSAPPDHNLAVKFPEIAKEWNWSRNGDLTPRDVWPRSGRKVWWKCFDGHEWEATVSNRTGGRGCPFCSGKKKIA